MTEARPRIGITSGSAELRVAAGMLSSHYVGIGYARAVAQAGGVPVILPPVAGSERALAGLYAGMVDGLVLSGGTDIHPRCYGEPIQPALTSDPDPSRDTLELALVNEARRTGLPVLGICRGLQILNVAYGGSLHQHQPHATGIQRNVNGLKVTVTVVSVYAGSRLHEVLGHAAARVHCIHHQGVDILGTGLAVSARSADGLVEAVEDASVPFMLGVLWHPEQMTGCPNAEAPYRGLISAAASRMRAAGGRIGTSPNWQTRREAGVARARAVR